jgi:hypothetical protein
MCTHVSFGPKQIAHLAGNAADDDEYPRPPEVSRGAGGRAQTPTRRSAWASPCRRKDARKKQRQDRQTSAGKEDGIVDERVAAECDAAQEPGTDDESANYEIEESGFCDRAMEPRNRS